MNDILFENEVKANKILANSTFATAAVFFVVWMLSEAGLFYVYGLGRSRVMYICVIITFCAAGGISHYYGCEKRWIKFVLLGITIILYAFIDAVFTYNVPLLIVIPIVLASRYFSKRFTILVTVATMAAFLISAVLGVFCGEVNLNNLELPKGTVVYLGEETWLGDVFDNGSVPFDRGLMVFNTLLYGLFVRFLQAMIVAVACISMSAQGKELIYKQKNLSENAARIGTELSLARNIQKDALPGAFPAFPDRTEFEIYASMEPAKEVGGDFYDFFLTDDDHLCMMIADVSGKGIPAAMFMMFAKSIIVNNVMLGKDPARTLEDANSIICTNNKEHMFVTVWLGILEISTGRLIAANGGHEYPMVMEPGGSFALFKDKHGFVVGGRPRKKYSNYEMILRPGSKLFVYTDGITEANNEANELFGKERLTDCLNIAKDEPPQKILEQVRKGVDEFAAGAEQFDDLTMLCIEYKGVPE